MMQAMTETAHHLSIDTARRRYFDGAVDETIAILKSLEERSPGDHELLQHLAEMYLQCGQYAEAAGCYKRAVAMQPSNPDYIYNLAASRTAFGELQEAESLYNRVIELNPGDYGAWLNRSSLRTQTPENNHVEQLKYVKAHLQKDDPGHIQICYSLAKELEDLAQYPDSFSYLQEGSHRRRLGMQYDVSEEEKAMSAIAQHFDGEMLATAAPSPAAGRPIFILGLPRSGTTLVDRITSSHSRVGSLGEHNTLPILLMKIAGLVPGEPVDRIGLIKKSASLDFADIGRRYCRSIAGFGNSAEHLIDKSPLNFLYLGLIHRAMPDARIIHMRRNPMDTCYAIYKTLFRAGYPFSYSLQETGRYYLAYRSLMDHWRSVIPDAFIDVDYESLIADQEGQTRRILDYLGLEWEENCMDFHKQSGPAATASAAQVRQPLYSSSVGLWRKYRRQLAPFAARLREHGVDVEDSHQVAEIKP